MRNAVASARDTLRTQLWPLPCLGVVAAVAAGVLLPRLESQWSRSLPPWLNDALFGGDAGAARTLLDALSTSLVTVTSLTFSLTVVTLQLASSQFSPRLLRTFTSDIFVQSTLAVFLATFTYALTVLRGVRNNDGVPRISVTVAFVLGIASMLCLVLFLAHLARKIRVETMLRDVHQEARATLRLATTPRDYDANRRPSIPKTPERAVCLSAPSSGFLTRIDQAELRSAAIKADAYVVIDCYPGSSLVQGVPIGMAWADHDTLDDAVIEQLQHAVDSAIKTGHERTAAQDVGYGLRQLADVANKALSPGINDPTTAVHALGHISALLCELAARDLGPTLLRDEDRVRVVLNRPDLAELLDLSITQPRHYGSADLMVMLRLFRLLEELAYHLDDTAPIRAQRDRLWADIAHSDFDSNQKSQLERAAQRIEHAINHGVQRR
ncbi:DUF2254 domain-containing protein [Mycobacterium ahvazicum]|uniref:DUF2254 domain-containing protein n=1 Tax=Mycobacterium ahvazicum TaxID=1964395 RepID=A0A2K4Y3X4_9MYCO|nr:DUF2254 domain-containing protein [Mycobacterium ahvazicum]SOX51485.1 DUF2254 domain-containing protein [Mycobacterium ahvazicum]